MNTVPDFFDQRLCRSRLSIHEQDPHLQRQRHEQAAHIALLLDQRDRSGHKYQRLEAIIILIAPFRKQDLIYIFSDAAIQLMHRFGYRIFTPFQIWAESCKVPESV